MGNKLLECWEKEYEAAHGFRPILQWARDGAILKRIREAWQDDYALYWAIKEYHRRDWGWEGMDYSVKMFAGRSDKLWYDYNQSRGGKARAEQQRRAAALEQAPENVVQLADRLVQRMGSAQGSASGSLPTASGAEEPSSGSGGSDGP